MVDAGQCRRSVGEGIPRTASRQMKQQRKSSQPDSCAMIIRAGYYLVFVVCITYIHTHDHACETSADRHHHQNQLLSKHAKLYMPDGAREVR